MRVLTELVSNDITVEQFPQIAPVLCPQLLAILTNDAVSLATRGGMTLEGMQSVS